VRDNIRDTTLLRAGKSIQLAVATIGADHFGDEDFPQLSVSNAELMCWYARNVTPHGLERNRIRFLNAGLTPVSIHFLPFRGEKGIHETTEVASFLWMLQACRIMGASVLKFSGCSREIDGGLQDAIAVLREVVPVAEEMGISMVVENHFQNIFEFREDYETLFAAIDSPNLGICLDMGHFASSGVDMIDLVEAMPEKIHHIDAKDCRVQGATDFVRFGTGIVPFEPVISRSVELGFSGYIVLELPRVDARTVVADLQTGIDLVQKFAS
jgi:sugar phosphate isomerase/epimerase